MKMPLILFFIEGTAPTVEESAAALEIGMVAMRNRSAIADSDRPERCDAVAGEVIPKQYEGKPMVKTLAQAVALVREKQKAENANAAASLANRKDVQSTSPAKSAKGQETAGGDGNAAGGQTGPGASWTKNA